MTDGQQQPEPDPRVQVVFYPPLSLRQAIDQLVGKKGRSQWIIDACREKLARDSIDRSPADAMFRWLKDGES